MVSPPTAALSLLYFSIQENMILFIITWGFLALFTTVVFGMHHCPRCVPCNRMFSHVICSGVLSQMNLGNLGYLRRRTLSTADLLSAFTGLKSLTKLQNLESWVDHLSTKSLLPTLRKICHWISQD